MMESKVEIFIESKEKGKTFQAPVCEGIQLEYYRQGAPGKLTFQVLIDSVVYFSEGDRVTLRAADEILFVGYIFTKKRDRDGVIAVTAYDQLRYFKNKHYYWYTNERADEVLRNLAKDFHLKIGEIEETPYVIPQRHEDNLTLFDIVQNALDFTFSYTGRRYVLFDKKGALCLRSIESEELHVPILIDAETAQNYDYESSIDRNTYNRIKIYHDDKKAGRRRPFVYPLRTSNPEGDDSTQRKWGVLQYCESIDEKAARDGNGMAEQLFENYCRESRRLAVKGAFGDVRVRGGSSLAVMLELGDLVINHLMIVERVTHRWETNLHLMDLELTGGDFH